MVLGVRGGGNAHTFPVYPIESPLGLTKEAK